MTDVTVAGTVMEKAGDRFQNNIMPLPTPIPQGAGGKKPGLPLVSYQYSSPDYVCEKKD